MEIKIKASDEVLSQLVHARREEVIKLQKAQADQIKDLETRGQKQLVALKKTLPKDIVTTLEGLDKTHEEAQAATKTSVARIITDYSSSGMMSENGNAARTAAANVAQPHALGWFVPYYGTLHGSDGKVYYSGYNPGNIDLSDYANGAGSGLFGTGAGSFTVYMDWWFTFRPTENRNYAHTVYVPFHGFYILRSDDGFWDSKEAHARIDISAVGYQYNYKATASTNVFDIDSQNINVNDRFDGTRVMYYSDLLGADTAYLRVTASFYVYARGGGSTAQLNFSDGSANYMGVPSVYIV